MKAGTKAQNLKRALKHITIGENPAKTFKRAALTGGICVIIFKFFLIPARLHGTSMEPAYRDGSINFINTLAYMRSPPERGDVVGIRLAGRRVMLLKRIIGMPGEKLGFEEGKLLIDGYLFTEPGMPQYNWTMPEVEIGPDEYFVAGDNRRMPIENHRMGRVSKSRITGKTLF